MNPFFRRLLLSLLVVVVAGFLRDSRAVSTHLTPSQWGSIRRILSHPETPLAIRQKTQKIVYSKYEEWAIEQAKQFRASRRSFCRHIQENELAVYAIKGLIRAIEKCDYEKWGTVPFSCYASRWIEYSLLDGMTELQPMTILPKKWRKRKGLRTRSKSRVRTAGAQMVNGHPVEETSARSFFCQYTELANTISDPFHQRVFREKYGGVGGGAGGAPRPNREVAIRVGCSPEKVRQIVASIWREIHAMSAPNPPSE